MRRVNVRKRGKVYQYQFEIGTINGKRKFINKSGFKTQNEAYAAGQIADNHINREFYADKPNQKWYTDVTEFNLRGEKIYLSPILDGYNGEIISHNISKSPNLEQINDMLNKGFWWQKGLRETIDYNNKDTMYFISIIRLPDFVTREDFDWAIEQATQKKKKDFSKVEFLTYDEGVCVQCMHLGPYDNELATIHLMHPRGWLLAWMRN